jgi:hypothetical protein
MNSILFSGQKPTNGKKRKSHKMCVFAQAIRIRNGVKILLISTTLWSLTPFTIANKTWSKVLAILFLKCTPKLNAYSKKKKECPNPIIISSNMGLEIWLRKCSCPHLRSTPHSQSRGRNNK